MYRDKGIGRRAEGQAGRPMVREIAIEAEIEIEIEVGVYMFKSIRRWEDFREVVLGHGRESFRIS